MLVQAILRPKWHSSATILLILMASASGAESEIDFNREIRPILAEYCFQCHGPDSASREAGLRLDRADSATSMLESGNRAIVSGSSEESELIRRLQCEDDELRMPPPELGKRVPEDKLERLVQWIDSGAAYAVHWAFSPVRSPELPSKDSHPIDALVTKRLEEPGWRMAPLADRRTLIRRLSFDLRGLPPTPEEIRQFLDDDDDLSLERLVDRFLASEQFGERMASFWLDGARYADTNGYQNDFNRSMWLYRDWVIRAFNENMPFDQFTIEQLAGDLLPDPSLEQLIATGFNRNNRTVTEAGSIDAEWLVENVVDRLETTSTVFLGLTIGCARCHDHKFDPVSQEEFYQMFDFFHQIEEQGVYSETRGNVEPKIVVPDEEQSQQLQAWLTRIQQLKQAEADLQRQVDAVFDDWVKRGRPAIDTTTVPQPVLSFPLDGSRTGTEVGRAQPLSLAGENEPAREGSPLGPAVRLDGTQWLECRDAEFAPESDRPFSVSLWMRPDNMGAAVSKIERPEGFRGFDILPFSRRISVHIIHQWPNNAIKVVTREALPAGRLSHVVLTYDGSSKAAGVHVFVNGVKAELEVEKDSLNGSIANEVPWQIGRRSGGNFLRGSLQDLRVFDLALTGEIVGKMVVDKLTSRISKDGDPVLVELVRKAFVACSKNDSCVHFRDIQQQRTALNRKRDQMNRSLPGTMVMRERSDRRDTFVLVRGSYDKPDVQRKVSADVPACLPPLPKDAPRNRLGLAKWLVSGKHPLTARVFVNRIWEQLFGNGIVKSSENFGYRCDMPSHPQLLDYLAGRFVESGWNIKALIRLIVTSRTYQQSSAVDPQNYQRDPDNGWLARGPRFRLSAEFVRDNALAISGLLSPKIGGPSVKPYQPEGLWDELAGGANGGPYVLSEGEDLYRRSLYTFRKRTVPHPTLGTFDAPSWEVCQVKRAVTNTPLQALALWNDTTYVEAARRFAEWMLSSADLDNDRDRICAGFEKCTGRLPRADELAVLLKGLDQFSKRFRSEADANALIHQGKSKIAPGLDARRLAAFTMVANTLLNLDETITRE